MERSEKGDEHCRNGGEVSCTQVTDKDMKNGPKDGSTALVSESKCKENKNVFESKDKMVLDSKNNKVSGSNEKVQKGEESKLDFSLKNIDIKKIEDGDTTSKQENLKENNYEKKVNSKLEESKVAGNGVKTERMGEKNVCTEKCTEEASDSQKGSKSKSVETENHEKTLRVSKNAGLKNSMKEGTSKGCKETKENTEEETQDDPEETEITESEEEESKEVKTSENKPKEKELINEDTKEEKNRKTKMLTSENASSFDDEKNDDDSEMDCDDFSTDISDKQTDDYPLFAKRASNDPNFAVVFSFLSLFGSLLNIQEFSLKDLEDSLDNCTDFATDAAQHGLLEKLHLKLLRRLSRSYKTQFSSLAQVSSDRLLKYLIRFSKHSELDLAWDLEKFGYHVLGSSERLILLKALCEIHFDENPRFKTHFTDEYIKTDNIDGLRLQPFGHDINGRMIWFQQDHVAGFRVYSEEEDDADGSTWKLIASNIEELDTLVGKLKKKVEVNPKDVAFLKRKERKEKASSKETKETKKEKSKSRTRQRRRQEMTDSESDEDDDNPCAYCYSNKRPDLVLLCDSCDAAYHTLCLRPPLMTIPEEDWHCPYCQQNELIELLEEKHKELMNKIKAIERASKRAIFDDIKLSNIVNKGHEADDSHSRRSGREKKSIDYNFSDFDQMIQDATRQSRKNTETNVTSFYSSTRPQNKRRLTNLDDLSSNSSGSEYEDKHSGNENETRRTLTKVDDFLERGCRRSRRLKKRFKNEDDEDSSSESEDGFVRRSTRRRCSAQKKYMDYGTDSDVEVSADVEKNVSNKEDDEEYEVSELDDDYEEEVKVRRRFVPEDDHLDDDDDDDIEEEETDEEFENEELHEDFKKNVIDDVSEEDADDNEEETDEDPETKFSYDSDDSEVCRKKKRKKMVEEEDSEDEKVVKKRGGKDMKNIIKSLKEEENKKGSKNADKEPEAVDSQKGSDVFKSTGSHADDESKGSDVDREPNESDTNDGNKGSDVNVVVEETGEDEKNANDMTGAHKDNIDEAVEGSDVKEESRGSDVSETFSGSYGDKEALMDKEGEEPNVEKATISRTKLSVAVKQEETDLKQENSETELNEKLAESEETDSKELLSKNELILSKKEILQEPERKETPSPLLNEFENAGLEKFGQESFIDSLNKSKPSQYSSNFQNNDPTLLLKDARSPIYPHSTHQPANSLPRRPDALPIPQQSHIPDIYRPKAVVGDFKQPYDYYPPQQHINAYSPMHSPYPMHSPQQAFFSGRQDHYPSHMQSMLKGAPPMYRGQQSLPGAGIWRPQETDDMGWGIPQHHAGYSPRTAKQPLPQGYPYIHNPDTNYQRSDYTKDYGMPAMASPSTKPSKKSTGALWPGEGKTASQRPSATESYAAFQSMVIGSPSDGQRKRSKKASR